MAEQKLRLALLSCLVSLFCCSWALAQTTAFTYQGRLTDGHTQANGPYQMEFTLYSSALGGDPVGPAIRLDTVDVANGVFTVELNFTAPGAFNGDKRWLGIAVKKPADQFFSPLTPRQPITSTPYALRTLVANSADTLSSSCTLCVTDAHIQAIDGSKVGGTVANATSAVNVSGVVQIANGGTGSTTKTFVDISTDQLIDGNKSFANLFVGNTFQLFPMLLPSCNVNDEGRVVYIFPNDVGQLAICAHSPLGFPVWRFLQANSLPATAANRLSTSATPATESDNQLQIEHLRDLIRKQELQITALNKLVCADHPGEALCKD